MKEIPYEQIMQGLVRIGISAALGFFVALGALMVFYGENSFGPSGFIPAIFIITTVIAYASAFGTNIGVSAISCPGIMVGKVGYSSAIPAGLVAIIIALFLLVESWSGAFGYIFNTVNFSSVISNNWKTSSVIGLAFAIFWATLYGELIAGSMVEMC